MSSAEDEPNDSENFSSKKRRVQRACDVCRRKKIRCDGGQMPDNKCSNCITYNYECTYLEAAKKRGPPKGYVESLETRLEKMEKLLNKLCPDADFSKELGPQLDKDAWLERTAPDKSRPIAYRTPVAPQAVASPSNAPPVIQPTDPDDLEPSDDEVMAHHSLVNSLKQIKLNPTQLRFFGKSSSIMFIQTAMDLKRQYAGVGDEARQTVTSHPTLLHGEHRRPNTWSLHPVRPHITSYVVPSQDYSHDTLGTHFKWLSAQLQEEAQPHEAQHYPESDLMLSLIELYFREVNAYSPLLHRPTFENNIKDGLHLRDEGFGSTVLLVCAIGARFSDDPRVFLSDYQDNPLSCGWEWFKQVQMIRKSLLAPPRLYDLQVYCLTAMFLHGSSAPQACWTIIGVGIRLAQDVGAHRKKVYNSQPTVEEELWKRAFWVLVSLDRSISSGLGRPCAIQDEDFDLDLPTECDDEYWLHPDPNLAFKQPPGKPSTVTFFNCFLRLNQILAFALRTIYSINKSKALLGFVGQQWEQHIVAELDSALNKWIDSVPDHLRWDPNQENIMFLNQSAHLYASYYQLQISVHRPFIPSPRKPSPLSFPSLAICTNAARSCTHVLDIQYKRTNSPLCQNQMALFTCGIVLLLNIWGGKRSGFTTDPAKEMADVHKCMKMLKVLEPRWHIAGRLWDVLYELASVGDLPLPQNTPPSHKRDRDADSPRSATSTQSIPSTPAAASDHTHRVIAGSRRVSKDVPATGLFGHHMHPAAMSSPETYTADALSAGNFDLPIHSDELGRLPLHPGYPIGHTPSESSMGSGSWFASPAPSGSVSTMPVTPQAGPSTAGLDPGLASMFAMHNPGVYDSIFSTMPSPPDVHAYQAPPVGSHMQQPQPMHDPLASLTGVQGGQGSFTDNTLAMWSNAPSNFEWDDWGTYISSVGGMNGMNNPMGSSRPAG
ncbi:uncharacterized protein FIBRA_02145 [Fibroporia radiculosa]|uniref:Zn(2)-C6 fungal-type domain-containing protein n=1 Tax=Fibroporia radiculosa TaxID=599839 RepID=J4G1D6_9APHY|nr:uncharacterized protein FIBRA_02145 [Fibroporia radiculosa]CCM00118.1 predicted protein [Fibroporia radiculosa]